jgi:hypothetical protein
MFERVSHSSRLSQPPEHKGRNADDQDVESKDQGVGHKIVDWILWFLRLLDQHNGIVTALGTLIIAVFTIVLAIATYELKKLGEKQARDMKASIAVADSAAKAAEESAKHLRNAERPYLTPFDPELRFFERAISPTDHTGGYVEVHLDITNIGKGVGFIKGYGIAHEICIAKTVGNKSLTIRDQFARTLLGPDGKLNAGAPFDVFQIERGDADAMMKFEKSLYVYGYVRYLDLFNIMRRTGFMFEFIPLLTEPEKSKFVMRPSPWWYDKEEEPSEGDNEA